MHADHAGVLACVDNEEAAEHAGDDRTRKSPTEGGGRLVVDANFIFCQVEDELQRAVRHDALTGVRGRIADVPQVVNKPSERWPWLMSFKVHGVAEATHFTLQPERTSAATKGEGIES